MTKYENNEIEIVKNDRGMRTVASGGGLEIQRRGMGIRGDTRFSGIVYLLIDCSSSMSGGNKLEQAKKGGSDFARDAMMKGYRVGLITFADHARHVCEPMSDNAALSGYLDGMQTGSSTHMADALSLAFQKLKHGIGNRMAVLVTDGQPTEGEPDPAQATLQEARNMRGDGIDIITIGTDDADEAFLKKIATRVDLAFMVEARHLERGIISAVKMLPEMPKNN